MRILFWDIDGTLVSVDGAGREAWRRAVEEKLGGAVSFDRYEAAGLTDLLIAQRLADLYFDGAAEVAAWLLERYQQLLPGLLAHYQGCVLPNVEAILDAADARDDVECALLTGNVAPGARAKLDHFGMFGRFAWGQFSEGTRDRVDLAQRALREARSRHGEALGTVYVIGDTPRDIECGHAIGARTIAVGTGPFDASQLQEFRAWWTLAQLPAADAFFERIGG